MFDRAAQVMFSSKEQLRSHLHARTEGTIVASVSMMFEQYVRLSSLINHVILPQQDSKWPTLLTVIANPFPFYLLPTCRSCADKFRIFKRKQNNSIWYTFILYCGTTVLFLYYSYASLYNIVCYTSQSVFLGLTNCECYILYHKFLSFINLVVSLFCALFHDHINWKFSCPRLFNIIDTHNWN